ncbi:hypothetical protein LT330_005039 [Penicillium expansum]|uniref:Tat pathway signal sequence n=1 Tax=Penicillium expansum TaxID=27334 RepID=A0A0A2JWL4_PENEN|nr:Protein of unknown function DUF3328 [Penicillium expansum]KAK4870691.1 hypothetical protein LT330_005039 [Penicillium expansum]KGO43451.1 Protein of unknown function DUF3328 [Penicillium expansum]KGO45201.1 Protein of unknown function DUF3328 [Penicillium expansum]KGO56590.1 Protein of unknown function DUF3328 [Penicillium expansum]
MSLDESHSSQDPDNSRPLLFKEDDEEQRYHSYPPKRKQGFRWNWAFILHGSAFAIYTIIFLAGSSLAVTKGCHRDLVYSPARFSVEYQKIAFDGDLEKMNPYRGPPRPEHDAAWHELLQYSNIRVGKDTLDRLNRSSIKLADGSGDYFGGLSVHHHLHCLKYVRHYLHRDYYNATDELKESNLEEHIDHCLDDIRQTLMCHADISIYTYDWIPNYRKPWPNFRVDHECVNWELLDDWAKEHSFSIYDQASLVHPELGLSFPSVNGEFETSASGNHVHFVHPDGQNGSGMDHGGKGKHEGHM